MQKLHKSKTPKVYKNKKLNNANFGTYNLNDYQVFLQLVSKLGKVDINGTYKQPQELERIHTITAKEFSTAFGIDLSTAYGVLKRAGKRLADTSLTLQQPELNEIWSIPVCRVSKYNTKEGSLTIEFNDLIMPYLSQIKQKFVLYNLKEVANFGSLYSTRLYELIQEFKDTGYIIKSVAQLRDIFAVGNKFKLYGDFKRKTFAHAVDEINAQYEMNLRFKELKEGRKVVSVRFEFTPSYKAQGYNPATKQMVNITVKPRRKSKQDQDDDNVPPSTPPKQPELTLEANASMEQKLLKSTAKVLAKVGIKPVPEVQKALNERKDTSTKETIKAIAKGAINADKRRVNTAVEATKEIITLLMKVKNLTEAEAKIFAIEHELI
jgi:plasmid replication initiation protein